MPHRDPETGQFLSHDDEPLDLTYSDHEFVNFRLLVSSSGDDNAVDFTEYKVEDDVLGLDNDELGMLSYLAADVGVTCTSYDVGGTTRGGANANVEIGSNLAGSEYLGESNTDRGMEQTRDDADVLAVTRANDEAGLWSILSAGIDTAFKDDGTAIGGGGDFGEDRQRRVFGEETQGGPYIDSTDDITVGVRLSRGDTNARINVNVVCQMAFVVFEYDNRRAQFAPM